MPRILTTLLILAGAFLLYHFSLRMTSISESSETVQWKTRPLLEDLGAHYPTDALLLAGALWCLGLGIFLTVTGGPRYQPLEIREPEAPPLYAKRRRGGAVARVFFLNALLLCTTLALAYVGVRYVPVEQQEDVVTHVGLFFGTAVLQVAIGLLLLILALFEKPKGIVSLLIGSAVYCIGATIWVLAFVWGS